MIRTDSQLAIEQVQLGHIEGALASLRDRVLPKNPRNFAIFSEAYVDQIDILEGEINAYLARKKYNAPNGLATQLKIENVPGATIAASNGHAALIAGETARASECYAKAGNLIEASIANKWKQSEKHHLRLVAAGQYYLGGLYKTVDSLCKRIQADLLPINIRPVLNSFRAEARRRSASDYKTKLKKRLVRHWESKEFGLKIETLREQPYCMHQANIAFQRALCLRTLGDYQAAAVFFVDSWRLTPIAPLPPENPKAVFLTAAFAYLLIHEGRLDEAAKCVQYQLKHIPHAITFINGSLLRYHQAASTNDPRRRSELIEEQLEFCDEAWSRFQILPVQIRTYDDVKLLMTHCLQCAAFAACKSDRNLAVKLCNIGVECNPTFWAPWTARGLVTYPERNAVADFAKAVELGDPSWQPYYFLALDAFLHENYTEAISWSEKALERAPNTRARAQMLMIIGISLISLDTPAKDAHHFFEEAIRLAPTDSWITKNWRVYNGMVGLIVLAPGFEHNIKPLETRDEYLARQLRIVDLRREQQSNASPALA